MKSTEYRDIIWRKFYGLKIAVDAETGVVWRGISADGQRTIYPYEPCKYGGWDNCGGFYTVEQLRRKHRAGRLMWS